MKKSQVVTLVLITSALASCHKRAPMADNRHFYMRSDTTAGYTRGSVHHSSMLWYYAFRPYGYYNNGAYRRAGYYSGGISESSNIGHSSFKSGTVRGGFGEGASAHGFSVSS